MLGIDQADVRVITPDVGGAFGAKFGADPEHAVVCWVARRLGRPARWAETRNENLVGMTHGRAQRQTVTIGGRRDGTVTGLPAGDPAGLRGLPAVRRVPAVADHPDGAGPYAFPNAEAVATSVVTNTTPVGAYRGAGRPEATAAMERAMDLFAAEIGVDPAEVRAQEPAARRSPSRTRPPSAPSYDTGDYAGRAGQGAGRGGLRGPAGRAGQAAGRRRRDPAGHRPVLLRRDHRAGARGGRPAARTPRSRFIPTAAPRS